MRTPVTWATAFLLCGALFSGEKEAEKEEAGKEAAATPEEGPAPKETGPAAKTEGASPALSSTQLKDHLERWGIKDYLYDDKRKLFFFGLKEKEEEYLFHVRLFGAGERQFLLVAARYVAQAKPEEGKGEVFFKKIASLNYRMVLGRIGWDEETGEVSCDYVLPVNGEMSRDAFSDVLDGVVGGSRQAREVLGPFHTSEPAAEPTEEPGENGAKEAEVGADRHDEKEKPPPSTQQEDGAGKTAAPGPVEHSDESGKRTARDTKE